ncbi:MAG: Gfo/Idh/MocA family oxidoreductase [bacterium]|nr:Gfo/Idh/MocA family oxidoreductase [bacterium]
MNQSSEYKKPVRVGIIGIGTQAQLIHIPILQKIDGVVIAGVNDLDEIKGKRFAQQHGLKWYDTPEDLFCSGIDAVFILTPNNSHYPLSIAALNAGLHVLVEKPLARTSNEAEKMIALAEKKERNLLVLMNQRFRTDTRIVKNYLKTGKIGDIYRIRCGWMTKWDRWNRPQWLKDKKISGGGVLMDYGIQLLDLVLWMLKYPKVTRVSAITKRIGISGNVEDAAIATLYLEKGIVFTLEVSWSLLAPESEAWLVFAGTKGRAYLNPVRIHVFENDKIVTQYPLRNKKNVDINKDSYESELRHFVEVLREGISPGATAKECLQALRVIEAIYESAKTGHEIAVDIGPAR